MNEERKYSNNSIFANKEEDTNNQNNITPNNEPPQINQIFPESIPSSEEQKNITKENINNEQQSNDNINQPFQESTTSLSTQEPNNDINQNITNDLIFDTNQNINNSVDDKSLSSQDLNSKPIENLPPTNQPNTDNDYNIDSEKKIRKNNILPIAIIAIVLITVGGIIVCKALPMFQNKFKVMINETFRYLDSNIKNAEDTTGTMTLKVTSTSDDESLKNLEKINFSTNYAIDYKNKLLNLDIKSNFDNDPLINASIYGQSKSIYVTLDELYDKTIEMPLDEEYDKIFTQATNQKDQKIVLKSINKALNNALKENYFTKGKDTVNGKKVDTTTLTINKDNYQTIREDLINDLLKDKSFLESAAKISDKPTSEIEDALKKALDEKEELTEEVKLTIYTKGTNFIKFEAKGKNTNISITANKDQYEYLIQSDGDTSATGTFKMNINKDETTLTLTMEYNEVLLELDTTSKKGANITAKETSNTINSKDMTESDLTEIFFNLMKNKGLTKLMNNLINLSNSKVYDYNYDYDYDADWSFTDSNL